MNKLMTTCLFVAFTFANVGCADDSVGDGPQERATEAVADQALSIEASDVAGTADGCEQFRAVARPIALKHLHDPKLQQTAGPLSVRFGESGRPVRTGTSVATLVGQAPDGTPLGNHHWLFEDGVLRTENDRLALVPTDNPCVVEAQTEIYVVDGTGAYAGYSGTLKGQGKIDFCGSPGRIAIKGTLCRAPAR